MKCPNSKTVVVASLNHRCYQKSNNELTSYCWATHVAHNNVEYKKPFRQILKKLRGFLDKFLIEVYSIKFHKNPSCGCRADRCGQTGIWTDGHHKAIRRFHKYVVLMSFQLSCAFVINGLTGFFNYFLSRLDSTCGPWPGAPLWASSITCSVNKRPKARP